MKSDLKKIPNTFGIEVTAATYLEYDSEDELLELIATGCITAPYLHIGGGSNLLFVGNYEGVVLHSCIKGVEVTAEDDESVMVRVGAGVVWDDFVAYCVEHGWYGAENLSSIPGEVGASAVQNIGAYGVEAKDLIVSVETVNINGVRRIYGTEECGYAYRRSVFKQQDMKDVFVTYVNFRLSKQERYTLDYGTIRQELAHCPQLDLKTLRRVIMQIRESKLPDPKVLGNAGSFFMNPVVSRACFEALQKSFPDMPHYEVDADHVKVPAGWMIERCGWKGKAMGPAAVHDKQALVLVNLGGAKGTEIVKLSEAVQASVREKFGIDIRPEVCLVG